MRLTIVRHAHAGDKRKWQGPDLERPLDELGRRQAAGLVPLLLERPVRRIVSSPALRCRQTVQPLADQLDRIVIEEWDDLGPQGHASRIVTACFGDPAFHDTIICTHGELLQPLLGIEHIRRLISRRHLPRERLLRKGTAWRLQINDDGQVTKLSIATPDVR